MNKLFEIANKYIPGGVNSPVRAFKAVNCTPIFIKRGNGANLYDIDDKKYIDYVGSFGPLILGHNHIQIKEALIKAAENGLSFGATTEIEVEMAKFICENVKHIEKIRMVNSGTEAVMSAIRVARGYTKKDKVIKFDGCYHGHSDSMLVRAGSGLMTEGIPDSSGVTKGCISDTISIPYNDIIILKETFEKYKNQIACVIIEPVGANMGLVLPYENYLAKIRKLCNENEALLIFDEVITGFRLGFGGACEYFNVTPDITTYGKIIGAGMPVGAYGGKNEIMSIVAPEGEVYQAGTLSGNPIAMNVGLTQLKILKEDENIYKNINKLANIYFGELRNFMKLKDINYTVNNIGSLGCLFFTQDEVTNYTQAKKSNVSEYAKYFKFMVQNGIYIAPSQFETMFFSNAHTEDDICKTLDIVKKYFR